MKNASQLLDEVERALKAGDATEHTHRPALKNYLEKFAPGTIATNEPARIACGSPDFIVTRSGVPLGYIEAKDVGVDLDRARESEQLKRYRKSLRNLVLTDYLEFRLFRNGDLVASAKLGTPQKGGAIRRSRPGIAEVEALLQQFFDSDLPSVSSAKELAERMARVTRLIHDLIRGVFSTEGERGDLHSQLDAFKKVLLADLSIDQFADMYAQTIAYGLFAARCNHIGKGFTRQSAGKELPKTNPFLRKLFNTIAGVDLDERISWAVDDLAELLARADMASILADFGRRIRQEDPVVHFYETFLTAYDSKLRETRGVYYTPEPVVGYIVRSVDSILSSDFGLKTGLADKSKVKLTLPTPGGKAKTKTFETHRVQILDPAVGTGTFLHSVVAEIYKSFGKAKGLWPSYVADHLLPRVYGFELLMAPYAVAHMKLGLQLQELGYGFASDERLRVFLTNSLEEGHELAGLPLFAQWLADEADAASQLKREAPIMVIVGNPPYSGHSANKGKWIERLLDEYKKSPELKKPAQAKWLSDDYVKFIRFAQWRIEKTGYGVLGFITNHSWLDNPTFLDMRRSLMETFDTLHILNLHGNSKKKESPPDGGEDKNVFDIQQGVAILLMTRRGDKAAPSTEIHYADLWGARKMKYEWLASHDVTNTKWKKYSPTAPKRLFVPQDEDLSAEWQSGWAIPDILNGNGDPAPGIVTTHDEFAISWSCKEAAQKVDKLLATSSEAEAREVWRLCSQAQWNYERAKRELATGTWRNNVVPILYRPFDLRWTVYDKNVAVHRRERVNGHMLRPNIAILLGPAGDVIGGDEWDICFASTHPTEYNLFRRGGNFIFPLWLYEANAGDLLKDSTTKHTNISDKFLKEAKSKLGKGAADPEALFAFVYTVLWSKEYRRRFKPFLMREFPRIPLTADVKTFNRLVKLGKRLLALHVMETTGANEPDFPVAGSNRVDRSKFENGRISINADQYFDEIEDEVWKFTVGGHQVAEKWLKDRKGKLLSFDDLSMYRHIIASIRETLEIQRDIDAAIPGWPM